MPRLRIGTVSVLAELGAGAGSRVFHVRRQADSREYALKVIPVEARWQRKYLDQARHEFRVGRMFDHPHLAKPVAFETETDWLFRPRKANLLLEYAPGWALDKLPLLPPRRLVRVFARVTDALAHMHDRGVCHADLKPGNVVLGPRGEVKVIDYGLAWVKGEPRDRVQGTPEYMAPETQARKLVSERTDIFNLGATLYKLVTLRMLPASSPGLVLDAKTYSRLLVPVEKLNPETPSGLCDLIHWCVAYTPEARPKHMNEVRDCLAQLVRELR